MLRFADFYADRRQTTDKPIALPPAAHARTRGINVAGSYDLGWSLPVLWYALHDLLTSNAICLHIMELHIDG